MKWIVSVLSLVVLAAAVYYFFFLPFEFKANFSAKTLPGDIIQTIRIWNRSLKGGEIMDVDSFRSLRQRIVHNDREYTYLWRFEEQDSSTRVTVEISEPGKQLLNKIQVPFGKPAIETDAAFVVKGFFDVLKRHLEITGVRMMGTEKHEEEFCLCRTIETEQINKAHGMMENFLSMSSFIDANHMTLTGLPSVRIKEWSHNQGKVKYDFCFPIAQVDSLPVVEGLEFKHFESFYGLKAEYNGNYITSDRAWYELYRRANAAGAKKTGLPVEYFVDNPNFATQESKWKAQIYLPVAEEPERTN